MSLDGNKPSKMKSSKLAFKDHLGFICFELKIYCRSALVPQSSQILTHKKQWQKFVAPNYAYVNTITKGLMTTNVLF